MNACRTLVRYLGAKTVIDQSSDNQLTLCFAGHSHQYVFARHGGRADDEEAGRTHEAGEVILRDLVASSSDTVVWEHSF